MAQPPAYQRQKDFAADYGNDTDNGAINNEFDAVAQSVNGLRTNLALIQRDDGGLAAGVVSSDSLTPQLRDDLYAEFSGNINDSVLVAQQAAVTANNAAIAAETARDAAAASAAEAATASAQAGAASVSAAASQAAAQASATSSGLSATTATSAATSATASQGAAAASASAAAASRSAADASAISSAGSATTATNQASAASGSAAAALVSQGAAEIAADRAEAAAAPLPWAAWPIGVPMPLYGNAPKPPTNDPRFRFIELTANLAGAGGYNNGVLTGESVSGSAPNIVASATISLAGSPLAGMSVKLVNTTREFWRPGRIVDVAQASQNASHNHSIPDNRASGSSFPQLAGVTSSPITLNSMVSGSSGGDESRPRNTPITYFLRVL